MGLEDDIVPRFCGNQFVAALRSLAFGSLDPSVLVSSSVALRHDFRSRPPEQVRVVVFGATGYIGRFVVKELVERGYQVVAFARERSGIGGRQSREQVVADFPGAEVRFGDVTNPESIAAAAFDQPADVIVSRLASRTGGTSGFLGDRPRRHPQRLPGRASCRSSPLRSAVCHLRAEARSWSSRRQSWPSRRSCVTTTP